MQPRLRSLIKISCGLVAVVSSVAFLVWQCGAPIASEDLYGAARRGDLYEMQRCLDRGADVNFLFDGATTTLESAVEDDKPQVAAFLLSKGADSSLLPSHYQNLLHSASFQRRMGKGEAEIENLRP